MPPVPRISTRADSVPSSNIRGCFAQIPQLLFLAPQPDGRGAMRQVPLYELPSIGRSAPYGGQAFSPLRSCFVLCIRGPSQGIRAPYKSPYSEMRIGREPL